MSPGPSSLKRLVRGHARRGWAIAVGILLVGGGAALEGPTLLENVHPVVPGVVYRSAQLDPEELTSLIRRDGIRSILNLRGPDPGASWYDGELAVSARTGVRHVDLELSAVRDVPGPQADRLVRLMRELPKPLLVHCQAGADRSGLAAALYEYAVVHETPSAAASQLSVRYGHVPFLHGGTAAMDRSYWAYVRSHPRAPAGPLGGGRGDDGRRAEVGPGGAPRGVTGPVTR